MERIYSWVDPLQDDRPPSCLGTLPMSLFRAAKAFLVRCGVDMFIPKEPTARELPSVLVIDGEDYIIASDFEVDVPQWEHRGEWFHCD